MTGFAKDLGVTSWGRVLRSDHQVARPTFRGEVGGLASAPGGRYGLLAVGLGRSYGDSGLNPHGRLIDMSGVDRLIGFDADTGILHAEAGVSLDDVLAFAVPRGWFLPVTPGTKYVTLGGAVANDVHGKNHTRNGTIGRWVREIGLVRTDGTPHRLRHDDGSELFDATVGGLGLTGIITDVALQLKPISSARMDVETTAFGHVSEFFELTEESLDTHEHTVAWIDCLAQGKKLGRGIFSRANHAADGPLEADAKKGPTIPLDMPELALNRLSIGAFNTLYYHAGRMGQGARAVPYGKFFYPLDAISDWNRMYGRRGMYQYQSVVPPEAAQDATVEMLQRISEAGQGSFLIVLKTFGPLVSPGMLSFPREGTTLALDFPNRGAATLDLLDKLDAIVREAGGRLYPAKDGRLPPDMFRTGLPRLEEFERQVDPGLSSAFWRRMHG